ncbi:ribonuclease H [Senna tora]|uniref:Ribonuclease H n=1 Tax=Senna tora TaxID=362788 RepID=A0A834WJC1_9FABA|nr:ribonuclease H [Senna tora]
MQSVDIILTNFVPGYLVANSSKHCISSPHSGILKTTTQTSDGACETSRTKSDPEIGTTDPNLKTLAASLISANLFFLSKQVGQLMELNNKKLEQIKQLFNKFLQAESPSNKKRTSAGGNNLNTDVWIKWILPNNSIIEINVDGSRWDHSGGIACGGVFRDQHGRWMGGFAKKLGSGNSLLAEVWGIKLGLDMAWNWNLRNIELEADSLMALKLIKEGVINTHTLSPLILEIRSMLTRHWQVKLSHTFKEGNRLADAIANFAHSLSFDICILEHPPDFCKQVLADDARGNVSAIWRYFSEKTHFAAPFLDNWKSMGSKQPNYPQIVKKIMEIPLPVSEALSLGTESSSGAGVKGGGLNAGGFSGEAADEKPTVKESRRKRSRGGRPWGLRRRSSLLGGEWMGAEVVVVEGRSRSMG